MQRILEAYDRSVFEITPSFIVVTFPYAADFERSLSEVDGKNERSLSEDELEKLKPILEYIESHDTITPQEARKLTGKSAATARRYLTLLCSSNLLEATGKTNTTAYKVIR